MKRFIPLFTAVALLVGCADIPKTYDPLIAGGVTVGVRIAMSNIPAARQTPVKNWGYYIASRLVTLTNPTPDTLGQILADSVPADIRANNPEIVNELIPAIVSAYTTLYNQYSTHVKTLSQILNDLATGVEVALGPQPNPYK